MKKLTLTYRDGDNYKCEWDVEVSDETFDKLPAPEQWDEGFVNINDLGLSVQDIPLIQKYGYDETSDHPYVKIVAVDGKTTGYSGFGRA